MNAPVNHANPLWRYQDARGVTRTGHFESYSDRGGTDVTYFFRDCATGELSLVSGARLRAAERIWVPCAAREQALNDAFHGRD